MDTGGRGPDPAEPDALAIAPASFTLLSAYREYPPGEMRRRAAEILADLAAGTDAQVLRRRCGCRAMPRRRPAERANVSRGIVVVSDPALKRRILLAAETEEREFYQRRASKEWLEALAPLGTDAAKPFLETAPYLIAIFAQSYGLTSSGRKVKNYYVQESVGIATGLLIAAVHHAGLVSLTHTPSPMAFLNGILDRPANERPFLLLVVGYPADGARVPVIGKKPLDEIATFR
jgi:hypothetical protein